SSAMSIPRFTRSCALVDVRNAAPSAALDPAHYGAEVGADAGIGLCGTRRPRQDSNLRTRGASTRLSASIEEASNVADTYSNNAKLLRDFLGWLGHVRGRRQTTVYTYATVLDELLDFAGGTALSKLTLRDLERFLQRPRRQARGPYAA